MLRQHIDFFAVCFIALVMIAISQAGTVTVPSLQVVRANNVVVTTTTNDPCPIVREVLANIESFLNQ
ncbi:MAG TPA: hypothetical protein VEU96_29630 [Bryobacteraceae bacterium]|nr:hypothetical protein [Bryobacteraceae bacterium]